MKREFATFTIPGRPVPKSRPRFSRGGHAYTPKKTADYEKYVRECFAVSCHGFYAGSDPVTISITAYFPIPQSTPKKKRSAMENGEVRNTKATGDFDNIAKGVTDPLNGFAWDDDCQIYLANIEKRFSENPRVEVTIGVERET